jgi:hypothetical protein
MSLSYFDFRFSTKYDSIGLSNKDIIMKKTKRASEITDMLESVMDEDRFKFVVVDAPEIHTEKVLDVLDKALNKDSAESEAQSSPEPNTGTPNVPTTRNPADRSDFVSMSPLVTKPHFRDICKCNTCGYAVNRNVMGVPCSSISCPKCGAAMCELPDQPEQSGIFVGSKPSPTGNL